MAALDLPLRRRENRRFVVHPVARERLKLLSSRFCRRRISSARVSRPACERTRIRP